MKKLVIGCGLALLLIGIASSVAFYYFVYKPARTWVASLSELSELAELDAKVANTQAFAAPSDDTLTEAQVRRFVAVQESLSDRMGTRAGELKAKYEALEARGTENVGLSEAIGAYRDLFGMIGEAKKAQVDAINAQNFSLEEYAWVKARFYEASGVEATGIDLRELAGKVQAGDIKALQEMVANAGAAAQAGLDQAEGKTKAPADTPPASVGTDTPGAGIPDANRKLVAPFKEKVAAWMVHAAFGL